MAIDVIKKMVSALVKMVGMAINASLVSEFLALPKIMLLDLLEWMKTLLFNRTTHSKGVGGWGKPNENGYV